MPVEKNIIIDYNGEGKWSMEQINLRYCDYCKQLKTNATLNISLRIYKNIYVQCSMFTDKNQFFHL